MVSISNRFEKTFMDKSTWTEGKWTYEPDLVQWIDLESGYDCIVIRHELTGGLNVIVLYHFLILLMN